LYTCLSQLNTDKTKIVTIEDPIEYEMEGVTQMQVLPEIGLDFAMGLRSMLRHDPDIMMVGEVRDFETAEITIRVALTGHLVFSTLHTNDAAGGVTRLVDMGIERYLAASALILICAQRLCRKICLNCKEPLKNLPRDILKDLGVQPDEKLQLFSGRGCAACNQTGYKGRTALLEALKVDENIKGMVIKEVSLDQIKEWAVKEGRLITLRSDGLHKALTGQTTIEEIYRVTVRD